MKRIVRGISNIRENAQTIPYPTSHDIEAHFNYTKGWVAAIYSHRTQQWYYSYCDTREETIQHWDNFKELVEKFPETFGSWFEYSEMVVFGSWKEFKPDWSLHFVIVED